MRSAVISRQTHQIRGRGEEALPPSLSAELVQAARAGVSPDLPGTAEEEGAPFGAGGEVGVRSKVKALVGVVAGTIVVSLLTVTAGPASATKQFSLASIKHV